MLSSHSRILAEAINSKILTKNHPDSLHSHSDSPHSYPDSPHSHPHSTNSHPDSPHSPLSPHPHPYSPHSHLDSPHSHPDSPCSHPDSPRSHHSPYSVPRFSIPAFTDNRECSYMVSHLASFLSNQCSIVSPLNTLN